MISTTTQRCTAYRRHGDSTTMSTDVAVDETDGFQPPVADRTPIRRIMTRDLVCARPDLEIGVLLGLMMRHRIGCVPVVDEAWRPIGVITKYDLVEQLEAAMHAAIEGTPLPADIAARVVDDVMMPIALTLDEHATVAHAAEMMKCEATHHVLVVDACGVLVGIVSAQDIVRWVVDHKKTAVFDRRPSRWYPLEG